MNREKKQELIVELKALDQQIKQVQNHIETVDQQIMELESMKSTLSEFSELKQGTTIKVPLVNGIFIEAELKNTKELLVNVGAKVSVKKTIPQVKDMLTKQQEELKTFRANMIMQFQQMVARVEEIQGMFKE
ncbi:prefoldin subunit alpha [Candidatus Woesearchaeota archaeon]|nr:prefoldin subunit alpha [Candidatus Woesearchaeota archaeon]